MVTAQTPVSSQQNDEIDLGKLLGILLDAKWLIAGVTSVFALLGVMYALLATPIYKADALIQVEQKASGMSSMLGEMSDIFASESSATTEIEIIKSRMVLSQTVENLDLTTQAAPNYLPLIGAGLARLTRNQSVIDIGRFTVPQALLNNPAFEPQFTLSRIGDANSQAYQLTDSDDNLLLEGRVGELAERNGYQLFVNRLEGDAQSFSLSKINAFDAVQWLQQNLNVSERGKQTGILLMSFEGADKQLISNIIDDVSQNYFLQNVARNSAEAEKSLVFLKQNLPEIKAELDASEEVLNRFRQANESIDLSLEAKSALEAMVTLESQLNELTFKETEISKLYTKDHPAYKSLLDKRQALGLQKDNINQQIQKLPQTQREVLRMTRDVEVNQQIYVQLLNKIQELSIVKAGTVGNVRILDNAQVYSRPEKPKKPLIVVLATLLGGMLSVALVLVKAAMNRGVENPDQLEAIGLAVYASVPKSTLQDELAKRRKHQGNAANGLLLLSEENPADLAIEALRGLRTSLHFAMMGAKNNILMISGSAPDIGKTFVSTNFAAIAAQTGQKVLIVDADMRKGYLHQCFGLAADNGLSDLLSGKLSTAEVVNATAVANLDIITRGQMPPNPSELLMQPSFKHLVDWASEHYDLVIIDTPPVLAVTDPSIVGAHAGTTLMVARFGQSSLKEIDVARGRFEQAGIEVKGIILNAVEKKASSSYGYGYYNYSYGSDNKA